TIFSGCSEEEEDDESTAETSGANFVYKFTKGQTFFVDLDLVMVVAGSDTVNDKRRDTIKQTTTFKYVVGIVDEKGTADITITYEHLKTPQFDSYDTTSRLSRDGMMFAGLMNYTLKTRITNKGDVLELTGGDNFLSFGQPDTVVDDNACLKVDIGQFFHVLPPQNV